MSCSPGGGGEFQVQPDDLNNLASNIEQQVIPSLQNALSTLQGIDLAGTKFSIDGAGMAIVYPIVQNFQIEDLKDKITWLQDQSSKLRATATLYGQSDESSTIQYT